MICQIPTVAFKGLEVQPIEVEVFMTSGLPGTTIVGLPDKAVAESRERVRSALNAMGLALPPKRITINLAPADCLKEGSHYDLPIALAILGFLNIIDPMQLSEYVVLGELGLDGTIRPSKGVLPAAIHAKSIGKGIICPQDQGPEACWAGELAVLAPKNLMALIQHFKGDYPLPVPTQPPMDEEKLSIDMQDVKGQETAKRALEIAAAGGHNLMMMGPPGSGKSMLAKRLTSILPPLTPEEVLEISIIQSVAGLIKEGQLKKTRPYRAPHYSASLPSIVGGGSNAKPGEISLAHCGVLFLDELPEMQRQCLEALRQPIEEGEVVISRAKAHVTYPAKFQFIAAMNPCPCGYLGEPKKVCSKAPLCGEKYQSKISGPLMDRIDIHIDVPLLSVKDYNRQNKGETSASIKERVMRARNIQTDRLAILGAPEGMRCNAHLQGSWLEKACELSQEDEVFLSDAIDKFQLSARAYYRILRVARTIADLENAPQIQKPHLLEALSYRNINYVAKAA